MVIGIVRCIFRFRNFVSIRPWRTLHPICKWKHGLQHHRLWWLDATLDRSLCFHRLYKRSDHGGGQKRQAKNPLCAVAVPVAWFFENLDAYDILIGVFLPTIVHVLIFTGIFVLLGALKGNSRTGMISFGVYVLCALSFLSSILKILVIQSEKSFGPITQKRRSICWTWPLWMCWHRSLAIRKLCTNSGWRSLVWWLLHIPTTIWIGFQKLRSSSGIKYQNRNWLPPSRSGWFHLHLLFQL